MMKPRYYIFCILNPAVTAIYQAVTATYQGMDDNNLIHQQHHKTYIKY